MQNESECLWGYIVLYSFQAMVLCVYIMHITFYYMDNDFFVTLIFRTKTILQIFCKNENETYFKIEKEKCRVFSDFWVCRVRANKM